MKNMIFGAGPPTAMRRRMLILYVFLFSFYVTNDYGFLVMVWHSIFYMVNFRHNIRHNIAVNLFPLREKQLL